MHADQAPYRGLYDDLIEYDGDALFDEVLRPWIAANDGERRWLEGMARRPGRPLPPMRKEESWRLYALSRILQLLQLSFEPPVAESVWKIAPVTPAGYAAFLDALGLETVARDDFHPFHHEIASVQPALDDGDPPRVERTYWPGCMLGPLLISRAGCAIVAGRAHIHPERAARSTLYWAFARNGRPTHDPGSGWGSNSQWRTAFRRDYLLGGTLYYNAGVVREPALVDAGLGEADGNELLRHRCLVAGSVPDEDRWPYDRTLVESA